MVRAHDPGAGGLEGEARLPRRRGLRLEDRRLARRRSRSGATGRLHAVRAGADEGRCGRGPTSGSSCASTTARGRSSSRASRATGTRGASGRPSTSRRGRDVHLEVGRVPPEPRAEAGRGARGCPTPRPPAPSCSLRVPTGRPPVPSFGRGARAPSPAAARREARCRSAPTCARGRSRTPTSTTRPRRSTAGGAEDRVKTYFGLREIGTAPLPGPRPPVRHAERRGRSTSR